MQTITADQILVADNPHGVDVRHLYKTKDVVVSQITLQPGEIVKPHKAPVDASFYGLQGAAQIEIEGDTTAAAAGTLISSSAEHLHSIRNESDGVARLLVVKTPNPAA